MITIRLSIKDCQLLLNACTALCEKTARSLATFSTATGSMYECALKQHDEAGLFYKKIEDLLENKSKEKP